MNAPAPTRSASRTVAARLLAAGAIVWMIAIAIAWGHRAHPTVDFHPINGSFQTFDPIRRMQAGQWPGRDFDVYLGLGPVYATRWMTAVFGGTFHASLVGTVVLCTLLHALLVGALARLVGASRFVSVILAAVGLALGIGLNTAWLPDAWTGGLRDAIWPVSMPGNSLLGLRAAAPLLAIAVMAGARRFAHAGDPGRGHATAMWVGLAAGVALPWSNDYGPVTWGLVLAYACVFVPRECVGNARVSFAALSAATSLVVAALTVFVATGGAPLSWWDYNWNGVAHDQAWYYHWGPADGAENELGMRPFVVGTTATIAWFATAWRTRRLGDAAVALYVACAFAAGSTAAWASHLERYFEPLYHLLWVTTPILIARMVIEHRRARHGARVRSVGAGVAAVVLGLVSVAAAAVPTNRLLVAPDPDETRIRYGVEVPEAGGVLPGRLDKVVWIASRIRAECDRDGLPVERRLVSTYATMLELLTGTFGPGSDDYLIHALGHARRETFTRRFRELEPRFVSTIREEFTPFEWWLRKQNWEFYREVIAHYDPWDRTPYALVWRRRAAPRPNAEVPVTISRSAPDERGVIVLSLDIDARHAAAGAFLVEVELTSPRGLLAGGATPLLASAFVNGRDDRGAGRGTVYGLPPDEPRWRMPVLVLPGVTARVELAPPAGRALALDGVSATAIVAQAAVDRVRLERLVSTGFTNAAYDSGIGRGEREASFLVSDPTDLAGVAPGDRLRFAESGERTILTISDRRVVVDGPPLSPRGDGSPHAIEVLPR